MISKIENRKAKFTRGAARSSAERTIISSLVARRDAVEDVAHEKMDQHFGSTERHGDAAERMPESIENAGCQLQPTK
jgi:hypothetical protein